MRPTGWGLVALGAGVAGFLTVWLVPLGVPVTANRALAVLVLMAVFWVTEAIPIHWTALAPLVLFPFLPIVPGGAWANLQEVAWPYVDPLIFLFLGGMFLAAAMEAHGLQKRIALHVMRLVGAHRLILGFLLASAFISLWISNTATAVMMVPIGLAVIGELERREGVRLGRLGEALMLAIAYGANVGGIGTKIGTVPNMQFAGFVGQRLNLDIGFVDYLWIGLPFVVMFLPIVGGVLASMARGERAPTYGAHVLAAQVRRLGPMGRGERHVLGYFLVACTLWIVGKPLKDLLGLVGEPDPIVAMLVALLMFLHGVIDRHALRRVSWDALILLGGSFALAHAVRVSTLADWAGRRLSGIETLHPFGIMLVITGATVLMSAVASNTSTTQVMLEVVSGAVGRAVGSPVAYLAGVSMAASCDFMLPAGTPPNAIVFGTGYVRLSRMARTGAVLDLAAAVLVAAWCTIGVRALF